MRMTGSTVRDRGSSTIRTSSADSSRISARSGSFFSWRSSAVFSMSLDFGTPRNLSDDDHPGAAADLLLVPAGTDPE
jgi:hypothetical protein